MRNFSEQRGANKKAIEIAKEMLKYDELIEKIIMYTKLSEEEVLKIKKNMSI